MDLGEYKLFYFVPDSIYSEQGQAATVYLTKAGKIMSVMEAEGGSDWFSSTEYKGERNGFSCDSISLDFEYAWFADENEKRNIFKQGEVRAPGYKRHELVCSEAPPKVAL